MTFARHHSNGNHTAVEVLTVKIKLCDGSYLTARIENTELVFKTGPRATSRFALSEILQLKNVSRAVTLRDYLWANEFEIYFDDGNRIVGVPKSPAVIHVNGLNAPHSRGNIPLWKIDSLLVVPNPHNEAEAKPAAPPQPAHAFGRFDRLWRQIKMLL